MHQYPTLSIVMIACHITSQHVGVSENARPQVVFFCDFKNENTHKPWTFGVVSPTLRDGKPSHPSLSEMIRNKPPLPLVAAQVSNLAR